MKAKSDSAGYIRLSGEGIKDSTIDLAQASELLAGANDSLRFYIGRENSDYTKSDYKLPIKIEQGSIWIYLLGIGPLAYAYAKPALGQMAQNDVGKKTSSEVFSTALRKMKSTVAIAKHRQRLGKEKIEGAKFDKKNLIGIPNSKGELLYVAKDELDAYAATPPKLYEPLVKNVSTDVDLAIGVRQADGTFQEETIDEAAKPVFVGNDNDNTDALVLPELVNNMYVELEGELSKGNERTNTMGLFYQGHTLTCEPAKDNIKRHKNALFGRVLMKGRVQRHYKGKTENDEDKKPRIIFNEIISLEGDAGQSKLL